MNIILSAALGFVGLSTILLGHYLKIRKLISENNNEKNLSDTESEKDTHVPFASKLYNGLRFSFLPLRLIGYSVLIFGIYFLLSYRFFDVLFFIIGSLVAIALAFVAIKRKLV